jgi:nitroreductase
MFLFMREEIMKSLKWRYAVQRFDPQKKIDPRDFEALEESLRMAPSSYGLQPWKFVVVQNPELREKLRAVSYRQPQITEASHLVVLAYKDRMSEEDVDHYMNFIAQTREVPLETLEGFKRSIMRDMVEGARSKIVEHWAVHQVYIAMGFVMQAAALMGIDSCPMEGLIPQEYDRLLGLENSGYRSCTVVAFGYRSAECKMQKVKKVRFPKDQVFKYL